MLININSEEEFKRLDKKHLAVLFVGSFCPMCRMMKPMFCELCDEHKIDYIVLTYDNFKTICHKYAVEGVPHFILFKTNDDFESYQGYYSEEELEKILKEF